MWALVRKSSYGELKIWQTQCRHYQCHYGDFFKIGFTIGGAIPLWLLAVYG